MQEHQSVNPTVLKGNVYIFHFLKYILLTQLNMQRLVVVSRKHCDQPTDQQMLNQWCTIKITIKELSVCLSSGRNKSENSHYFMLGDTSGTKTTHFTCPELPPITIIIIKNIIIISIIIQIIIYKQVKKTKL